MTLPTPETPPTMGLHLQRGPIPDSLGPPDPCPAATPNFLSGTQGQLETGSGFSKYAEKMKRKKKTPSYISFVSSTDEDSLTVISSDTCDQEKILKTVCPLRGTLCLTQKPAACLPLGASSSSFFFPAQGRGVLFHPEEI